MDKNTFLDKISAKHKDLYDYSLIGNKLSYKEKIQVICKKHNYQFSSNLNDHIRGAGCPLCKKERISILKRMTVEDFVKKANIIHSYKYDYSKIKTYNGSREKIEIVCKEHGSFFQSADSHINQKCGCPICAIQIKKNNLKNYNNTNKITTKNFIDRSIEIFGDVFDYSQTNYIDMNTPINIICKKHGMLSISPANHLHGGCGCKQCAYEKNTLSQDVFLKRALYIHGNEKYDYSQSTYKGMHYDIDIMCKKHGMFITTPYLFLNHGCGCIKCGNGVSLAENEIFEFIRNNYSGKIIRHDRNIISPLEIDIFLPELNVAIEYNGLYWHSDARENINKYYHLNKTQKCESMNIQLIHIFEDDWLYKQDIVKSRLLNILKKSTKIYARHCIVKEVSCIDAKLFLENNHIQGFAPSSINIGLYLDDILISLMTFCKLRRNLGNKKHNNNTYELLRLCTLLNTTVIGGANKLFNYFIKNYKHQLIISYADRSWSYSKRASVYDKMGFVLKSITQPNYWYVFGNKRKNRFSFRKDILVKEGYDVTKSELQIMRERNIYRIYNSGNLKYEYNRI